MATSTMQATNGGIINWRPLISPFPLVGSGAGCAERPVELRNPEVHEIKVGVDAGCAARVRRHDHGLRSGCLRDLEDLIVVVVVRRQQHMNVLFAPFVDYT